MIIVTTPNKMNCETAEFFQTLIQYYPDMNLNVADGDTLFVLDLNYNGDFQRHLSPDLFVEQLIKKGLPEHIKNIDFIVSDINPQKKLSVFAQEMVNYLNKKHHERAMTIHVITDLNYKITMIDPPKADSSLWKVYGFKKLIFIPSKNEEAYRALLKEQSKILLWEGADITQWLRLSKQREFEASFTLTRDIRL